jgi:hypothetical protein
MHVELHHFASEIKSIFDTDFDQAQVSFPDILRRCLSAPYLMNEALALSSLHICIIRPDQRQIYRHRASHMQQHALSIFNAMKPEVNVDSCLSVFSFFVYVRCSHALRHLCFPQWVLQYIPGQLHTIYPPTPMCQSCYQWVLGVPSSNRAGPVAKCR